MSRPRTRRSQSTDCSLRLWCRLWGEALLSLSQDAQVGPIVTLAAGGILAELYEDKAVRLAPVDLEMAREMVSEIRAFAPLRGYRNLPEGDLGSLADAVVAVSRLAVATDLDLQAVEINPLLISAEGALAVDALIRVGDQK